MANYPDLDKKMRINFLSGPQNRNSRSKSQIACAHLGTLVYNGYNMVRNKKIRRIKCTKCNKRFENDVVAWDLLQYQQKIKKILYEWLIYNIRLKELQ